MKAGRRLLLGAFLACFLLLSGCWSQNQFEEIGFILQMGLETAPGDNLLMSITVPVVETEVKEKAEFQYTTLQRLIRSSREVIRNVSGRTLQGGKIQHLYFSRELAQKGINEFLEVFLRDPENPLLANVIVVDGSPKEMMEEGIKYKDKPRLAIYVAKLIQDAHRRYAAPEARIYNFSIRYFSGSIDPVATLVRFNSKEVIMAGSALFSGDKMVGEINTDQTMLLNAINGQSRQFEYIYRNSMPDEPESGIKKGAAFMIQNPKCEKKVDVSGPKPVISVKCKCKASLDEDAGPHNLDNTESQKKVEKVLEDSLSRDLMQLLEQMRDVGSDPLGFGEIVRTKHNSYWKTVNWKEIYAKAEFKVDVKVVLESYGTIK